MGRCPDRLHTLEPIYPPACPPYLPLRCVALEPDANGLERIPRSAPPTHGCNAGRCPGCSMRGGRNRAHGADAGRDWRPRPPRYRTNNRMVLIRSGLLSCDASGKRPRWCLPHAEEPFAGVETPLDPPSPARRSFASCLRCTFFAPPPLRPRHVPAGSALTGGDAWCVGSVAPGRSRPPYGKLAGAAQALIAGYGCHITFAFATSYVIEHRI